MSSLTIPSSTGSPPSSRTASARMRALESYTSAGFIVSLGEMTSSPVEMIATRGLFQTETRLIPTAASTPVSRLVSLSPRLRSTSFSLMSVPAYVMPNPVAEERRTRRFLEPSSHSSTSVCSIITMASAPRGSIPPVAILAADCEEIWVSGTQPAGIS